MADAPGSTQLDDDQCMRIEWACTRLVNRFNQFGDAGRFEDAAACFAEDGSFLTPAAPDPVEGRAAILSWMRTRPPLLFRHFATNIVIDVVSEREARGRSYMILAVARGSDPAQASIDGPLLSGEIDEHFVLTEDGWRFGHRRGAAGLTLGRQPDREG